MPLLEPAATKAALPGPPAELPPIATELLASARANEPTAKLLVAIAKLLWPKAEALVAFATLVVP